jgi:DNA-directed RNA polymerase
VYGKKIPSPGGFASGISPNFIHSMDAAHMALIIHHWDGDFAAIHDSFSTHACDVASLLSLTKEVFIKMYNHRDFYKDIAEMLLLEPENFNYNYKLGELDVEAIQDSDYFFS